MSIPIKHRCGHTEEYDVLPEHMGTLIDALCPFCQEQVAAESTKVLGLTKQEPWPVDRLARAEAALKEYLVCVDPSNATKTIVLHGDSRIEMTASGHCEAHIKFLMREGE